MNFRVTMKTPASLDDSIDDAVRDYLDRARDAAEEAGQSLSEDDLDSIGDEKRRELRAAAEPWFRYGEYLTVEVSTDGSCRVVRP